MSIAGMFGASGSVFLLTGGQYGTNTLSNWLYIRVQQSGSPTRSVGLYRASALGLCMTVVSCAIAFTVRRFLLGRIEDVQY
jgi:ABC-type sulfate transport system permease component